MIDKRFSGWQARALNMANSAVASAKENLELTLTRQSKANDDVRDCENRLCEAKATVENVQREIEKDGDA